MTVSEDFTSLTGRFRSELLAHCYRMLGSAEDAMSRATANGQPAFAAYQREPGGAYHAHAVLVPTVTTTGIARIVSFLSPGLFGSFGLPRENSAAAAGPVPAQDPAVSPWLR